MLADFPSVKATLWQRNVSRGSQEDSGDASGKAACEGPVSQSQELQRVMAVCYDARRVSAAGTAAKVRKAGLDDTLLPTPLWPLHRQTPAGP